MNEPKTYTIPAPLMQTMVNTLGALPWFQVNPLMSALVPLVQAQDAPQMPEPPHERPDGQQ